MIDKIRTSIFEKFDKNALREFIDKCSSCMDIDKERAYSLAINAIKYYRGNKLLKEKLRFLQDLEKRWYDSLDEQNPDYSIYNEPYFLSDVWSCWVIYSRGYLLSMKSKKSLGDKSVIEDIGEIGTIVDLGCGFGYTTAALKEMFPMANVFGTNFKNSCQWNLANIVGKEYGFSLIPNVQELDRKFDFIFASEYFEHIENPIEHLIGIINANKPRFFLIANSFNSISIGHFRKYKFENDWVDGRKISRIFNNTLREFGYEKVKTNFWNNRPSYWRIKNG